MGAHTHNNVQDWRVATSLSPDPNASRLHSPDYYNGEYTGDFVTLYLWEDSLWSSLFPKIGRVHHVPAAHTTGMGSALSV